MFQKLGKSALLATTMGSLLSLSAFNPAVGGPKQNKKAPTASTQTKSADTRIYDSYSDRLRDKVLSAWECPNGKNDVTLSVTINQDGSVKDLVLSSSPNNGEAEQAANDAFNKAQPLGALPGNSSAKLVLHFVSTVDPHGDSSSRLDVKMNANSQTTTTTTTTPPGSDTPATNTTP